MLKYIIEILKENIQDDKITNKVLIMGKDIVQPDLKINILPLFYLKRKPLLLFSSIGFALME